LEADSKESVCSVLLPTDTHQVS